jgi:TPR repeat protein
MPEVFVSYKREERPRVERLATALSKLKLDVWFDAELRPGETFLDAIHHALAASKAVLVCWTEAAARSPYVLGEAQIALQRKVLVPVFFSVCNPPAPFNMVHTENLMDWQGEIDNRAWLKALGQIAMLAGRPGLVDYVLATSATEPSTLRSWVESNPRDPLVADALDRARSLEGRGTPKQNSAFASSPHERTTSALAGPVTGSDSMAAGLADLGPEAEAAARLDDGGVELTNLGVRYAKGVGVPLDQEAAKRLYEAAAEKGCARAFFNLGLLYFRDDGLRQDYARALRYFELAASGGEATALVNIGLMYDSGKGVSRDYKKAIQYYELAAAKRVDTALANLGVMYAAGRGVPQDWTKARQHFEAAAALGNAGAMDNLGTIYNEGKGVPRSYEQARRYYEQAAARGSDNAECNLGGIYFEGAGVRRDYKKAIEHFERAAQKGHVPALINLGGIYMEGSGVPPDRHKAIGYYEEAASNGHAVAFANLGVMFSDERDGTSDYKRARWYFRRAYELGQERAGLQLARLLEQGRGGPADPAEAIRLYQRCASQTSNPQTQELARQELRRLGFE